MTNDIDIEMDEMQEIIDDFLVEADELINSLDTNLVKLETSPDDLNLLNEIFRAAHTITGTSSFLGFDQVTSLTHKMEDILNKLRKGEMVVTPDIMDLLLESLDILKVLLGHVREKVTEEIDLTGITGRLVAAQEAGCGDTAVADNSPVPISDSALEAEIAAAMSPQPEEMTAEAPPDAVVKATPTAETAKADTKAAPQPKKPASDQTIRVDVERLDSLMNMMGELVLARNSLMQTQNFLNQKHDGDSDLDTLNQATNSVNFITTELQMAVMKMRMLPIGKVFRKFPRLVRDLARDSKKQIDLVIEGETTELDKTVIEEIGDPLVHIIRNSCDHGIESPEERIAKGKPAKGLIRLEAAQKGSNIVIKIIDDGRGFDVDAIRDKAVERGLASREEVDRMPDREAFAYTFQAGFSTAKKITDVSGRGVGMDVVRTNIEKLSGMIELDSTKDKGSTLSIKLPLTLAIIQGLLVESDKDIFILPLASVIETVKTKQAEVYYVNQRPVFRLREDIIPIINLNEILNESPAGFIMTEKPYIVVVALAEKKLGVIVDRFLGQEEVVIKSLGQYLGTTQGIAGATILGDGRVRLIVDLIGLFSIARKIA